jgi:hypothetical protein
VLESQVWRPPVSDDHPCVSLAGDGGGNATSGGRAGLDLRVIQDRLGHRNIRNTAVKSYFEWLTSGRLGSPRTIVSRGL